MKEKKLHELQMQTNEAVTKLRELPTASYKFENIDSFKKEIDTLVSRFNQIFSSKSKDFFILVLKDKILIFLALVFVVLCVLTVVL